ncbi:MAG: acyl carrier protein [Bacteroidota bacterium]
MKTITKTELIDFLKRQVVQECGITYEEVDVHREFVEFRMDSVNTVFIMDRLEKHLGTELSPLYFWDHPTIDSLSEFLINHILKNNNS